MGRTAVSHPFRRFNSHTPSRPPDVGLMSSEEESDPSVGSLHNPPESYQFYDIFGKRILSRSYAVVDISPKSYGGLEKMGEKRVRRLPTVSCLDISKPQAIGCVCPPLRYSYLLSGTMVPAENMRQQRGRSRPGWAWTSLETRRFPLRGLRSFPVPCHGSSGKGRSAKVEEGRRPESRISWEMVSASSPAARPPRPASATWRVWPSSDPTGPTSAPSACFARCRDRLIVRARPVPRVAQSRARRGRRVSEVMKTRVPMGDLGQTRPAAYPMTFKSWDLSVRETRGSVGFLRGDEVGEPTMPASPGNKGGVR
jgi:hypothetical protein